LNFFVKKKGFGTQFAIFRAPTPTKPTSILMWMVANVATPQKMEKENLGP
jgi:hypothetical protein